LPTTKTLFSSVTNVSSLDEPKESLLLLFLTVSMLLKIFQHIYTELNAININHSETLKGNSKKRKEKENRFNVPPENRSQLLPGRLAI